MATALLAGLTPDEAVSRGHDAVDVMLQDWGTNTKDSYPIATAAGISSFPLTPAGVMIGPRSTVDRCWVSWNTQIRIPGSPLFVTRELSVDTPLLFAQPASRGVLTTAPASLITDAQDRNLLFVFPTTPIAAVPSIDSPPGVRSTVAPANYVRADGSAAVFGPTNVVQPFLHLRFFLKTGLSAPSTKRFPYQNFASFTPLQINTEFRAGIIATFGRKNIVIQTASSDPAATIVITALRNSNPTIPIQETIEGIRTTTAANQSVRFQLCDPAADWIIIYVTPTGAANTSFSYTITAYD